MHGGGFFLQAFLYLAAAVLVVPIAKRVGLGSVLGYLIAGVLIGPFVMGLIGEEGQDVMHFAEFGVVMMLFVVGLELEPSLLWRLRGPVLGLGGAQVAGTTLAVSGVALACGLKWQVALAVGLTLALSSTAIVLQTLNEKGLMKTQAGQSSFSVLLFQGIAVIPMLALMPLLATGRGQGAESEHATNLVSSLPGWGAALVVLATIAALVAGGRFLLRPLFGFIARARLRETFTAAALLLVVGVALLMSLIGLSPALGTFVAGVVLATSEYRHELEAEIEPFKGLLLGLFFIAVGASIDFGMVAEVPVLIASLVLGLMALKFVVLFILARVFRMGLDQGLLFSFALAQGGEFAFVLFSFAEKNGVIPEAVSSPLIAAVALSMALTPLAMIVNERLLQPRFGTKEASQRTEDLIEEDNPVIVAGFGRFGQITARLLRSAGIESTLLDFDSDQVDLVRRFGTRVYYGDATRVDLLRSAGAEKARILVIALDNPEKAVELAHTAKKHFPQLEVFSRARARADAFELHDAGVAHIYRETLDSSLALGAAVLQTMGTRAYKAKRLARAFRRHDEAFFRETAEERHQAEDWVKFVRSKTNNLEKVLKKEHQESPVPDVSWDTSTRLTHLPKFEELRAEAQRLARAREEEKAKDE